MFYRFLATMGLSDSPATHERFRCPAYTLMPVVMGSLKFRSFPSSHVAPDTPEEDLAYVAADKTCWLPLIRYRVAFFNSHLRGYT